MEPDSVIEDKTIELMVSAARWPSVLPAGRRPGGLPTSASAPGQPSFPAVWARPAPCYGSLLTPPALGSARPPLPAPPPHPPPCRAPASLGRPCLAPAGATAHSRLAITLFLEGDFFFPSLDSSGQACIALPNRAQAEGDGGGRESETSWSRFGLRNRGAGVGWGWVSASSPQGTAVWMPGYAPLDWDVGGAYESETLLDKGASFPGPCGVRLLGQRVSYPAVKDVCIARP